MRCFLGCFRLLLLASFLCLVMGVPAQANVTITASDVDLAPGGTGTMDFTITSDPGGTLDTLSDFGLELLITPAPTSTSLLQFTTAQSNPYGNPNYVFAGESFGSDLDLAFWSKPSKTNYPADTIYGGDLDDGLTLGYVTIPSTAGGLYSYLATVQFQAPQGANVGDQFQISLVNDPNYTYFDDQNGNPINYSPSLAGGLVSVVPEPSTLAVFSGLAVMWPLMVRRRRKRAAA
ncbi:MAG: PEP-CTERM sorting domain-containing protein [Thermoguttaceae bacterium]